MRNRFKLVGLLAIASLSTAFAEPAAAQSPTVRVSDARTRDAEAAAPRATWAQVRVEFEGNRLFTSEQLRRLTTDCYGRSGRAEQEFDPRVFDYCLRVDVIGFMRRSGYLRAELGETRAERTASGETVTVPLDEKELYRLGEVRIEGAETFAPERLRGLLPLKAGDIADGEAVLRWLSEHLKRLYGEEGFIQYEYDVEPEFRLDTRTGEGVADLKVTVNEGRRFRLRSLAFKGCDDEAAAAARGVMDVRAGEVFNMRKFADAVEKINALDLFYSVNADSHAEFTPDEETAELDVVLRLQRVSKPWETDATGTIQSTRPDAPAADGGAPGRPTLKGRRPQTREE